MNSDKMFSELERLRTFENNWTDIFVRAEIMAKTGFYYIGPEDRVKCYFCEVQICRWEVGDEEITEHLKWSPNCPFLKRRKTNNIPIEPIDELQQLLPPLSYDVCGFSFPVRTCTSSQLNQNEDINRTSYKLYKFAEHPEYVNKTMRMDSFKLWPKSMLQKPEDLSDAGFFYTGKGDIVKCFSCNGSLKDWEDEKPWEEHAYWFEKCEYLNFIKDQSYIETIKQQKLKAEHEKTVDLLKVMKIDNDSEKNSNDVIVTEKNAEKNAETNKLCIICCENEYNTIFIPWNHVCACTQCTFTLRKCPVCREQLDGIKKIFLS